MKETLIKGLANLLLGGIIAVAAMMAKDFSTLVELSDKLRIASDGFFVAGALLLAWGGLTWTVNGGAVDGLGYSMKTLRDRLLPNPRYERQESFAAYRERKHAKDRSPVPAALAGAVHLAIAVALLLLYNKTAL